MGPIADDIRAAVSICHDVIVRDALVPGGALPRTANGAPLLAGLRASHTSTAFCAAEN
jgi:hypothetical protein